MSWAYDAVLLASFGGPEGPDEVMPFLERVTAGRGVPRERLEEVSHHYLALGGVSPINSQNRALLAALASELTSRGVRVPIVLGNRNSQPYFPDVLAELSAAGHRRILALATSAYPSYSGCRQYREDLGVALATLEPTDGLEVVKLPPFHRLSGFVAANAALLAQSLVDTEPNSTRILFTTHSIPVAMAAGSGPEGSRQPGSDWYSAAHLAVAEQAVQAAWATLGRSDQPPAWELVYQSRSGPPQVPWLEPDINDALPTAATQGVRTAIVAPIGFISDHIEVIWDLDNEARQTAAELGLSFRRVPTVGTHPLFVAGLADLLAGHLTGSGDEPAERVVAASSAELAGYCSAGCCPNLRATRPVVGPPAQRVQL